MEWLKNLFGGFGGGQQITDTMLNQAEGNNQWLLDKTAEIQGVVPGSEATLDNIVDYTGSNAVSTQPDVDYTGGTPDYTGSRQSIGINKGANLLDIATFPESPTGQDFSDSLSEEAKTIVDSKDKPLDEDEDDIEKGDFWGGIGTGLMSAGKSMMASPGYQQPLMGGKRRY